MAVGNKEINLEKQLLPEHKDRVSSKNKSRYYKSSLLHKKDGNKTVKFISDSPPPLSKDNI